MSKRALKRRGNGPIRRREENGGISWTGTGLMQKKGKGGERESWKDQLVQRRSLLISDRHSLWRFPTQTRPHPPRDHWIGRHQTWHRTFLRFGLENMITSFGNDSPTTLFFSSYSATPTSSLGRSRNVLNFGVLEEDWRLQVVSECSPYAHRIFSRSRPHFSCRMQNYWPQLRKAMAGTSASD